MWRLDVMCFCGLLSLSLFTGYSKLNVLINAGWGVLHNLTDIPDEFLSGIIRGKKVDDKMHMYISSSV